MGSIGFKKRSGLNNSDRQMSLPFATPHSSTLPTKSKKKISSLSLQRLHATKQLLGLPNMLNKNNNIPDVLCAIMYP